MPDTQILFETFDLGKISRSLAPPTSRDGWQSLIFTEAGTVKDWTIPDTVPWCKSGRTNGLDVHTYQCPPRAANPFGQVASKGHPRFRSVALRNTINSSLERATKEQTDTITFSTSLDDGVYIIPT
ncbi:hypothetical protein D9615_006969 [Tricholomella constricta]|uniref:Uncharacterized protein n=1 Tax=Tricholomella constricta TaxID=117010 RepID=A0A8H5H8T1_9AGAR|nr:hypothetical protein D9615_006969 [Tricholomella constricta]